jgi:hypothetical protein
LSQGRAPDLPDPRDGALTDRSTAEFRAQVVRVIMHQAQRASKSYVGLGILLFLIALALFAVVCYNVYHDTQSTQLAKLIEAYGKLSDSLDRHPNADNDFKVSAVALSSMAPLVTWALLCVSGIFLVRLGFRLLQRRVVQEALSELGPLQAVLAGIPPRKPFLQVTDQSLSQAQRSFSTRLMLSVVLFWVGLILVLFTVAYGLLSGMTSIPKWLTAGVLGGGSFLSFIFGAVLNQQSVLRATLQEITSRELSLARYAQRAELVDALLAVLSRSEPAKWDLSMIRSILAFDELHQEPPVKAENAVGGAGDTTVSNPTSNSPMGAGKA